MKWLTALLAATTLAFAGGSWHLAKLLRLERERNATLVAAPVPLPAPAPAPTAMPRPAPATAPQPVIAAPDAAAAEQKKLAERKQREAGQAAITRRRLEQMRDPVARAEMVKMGEAQLRDDWTQIGRHIGMSPSEVDQFITDMTERTLQVSERQLQCELDPACDRAALRKAPGMSQSESIAAAMGPDRYASYRTYQDSSRERSLVSSLNKQLPAASTVNDATSDRLVQALMAQRKQFKQDAEALGEKVDQQGQIYGSAMPGSPDQFRRRRQTATEYMQRALQIAGGILDAQQLAAFRSQLERDLYNYMDQTNNAEVSAAARAAAGQR